MSVGYQDVERIIRKLLKKWYREHHLTPFTINCGNCETFAHEIEVEVNKLGENNGGSVWGEDNPELFIGEVPDGHCFYWFDVSWLPNRFYDSECITGVVTPIQLPFYERYLSSKNRK
jgi:hypothetical protein